MKTVSLIKVFSTTLVVAAGALAQTIWNGTANTSWYNAEQSSFTITTAEQLAGLAELVNDGNTFSGKTINLDGDVDLDNKNWTPVGSFSNQFKGTFDGNKNSVQNLSVQNPNTGQHYGNNEGYAGFFGYIGDGGQIKNVLLNVTNITTGAGTNLDYAYAGGLAGLYSSTKTIEHCAVIISGSVSASAQGFAYSGGLVGFSENNITVNNSYANGTVSASAQIDDSYSGGLIGYAEVTSSLTNCYANVTITATGSGNKYIGGIFGAYYSGTNTSVYYNLAIAKAAGHGTPSGIIGITSAQIKTESNFSGWDFANLWEINPSINDGYPYLRAFYSVKIKQNPDGNRPFPQAGKFEFGGTVIKPNITQEELNSDILTKYNNYRDAYLKSVQASDGERYYAYATGEGNSSGAQEVTLSETHGYAMIIFALMAGVKGDEKAIFDGMNRLRKAQKSTINANLMSWIVTDPASNKGPDDSATDGDLDNAYALLLAYRQWGDESYLNDAKTLIAAIKSAEMGTSSKRPLLGDWQKHYNMGELATRSSDWMPGHFRAFAEATKDNFWLEAVDTVYKLISQVSNPTTGLIPDFVTGRPAVPDPNAGGTEEEYGAIHYFYNACRDPWRLATDYFHHGTPAAKTQIDKISTWLRGNTRSNPDNIKDGYKLDGTALLSSDEANLAFVAPFAAGMIANPSNQVFLDNTYVVVNQDLEEEYFHDDKQSFEPNTYAAAIQLLNMLLISGNWWAPYSAQKVEQPTVSIFNVANKKTSANIGFAGIRNGQINLNLKSGTYTAQLYNLQGRLIKSVEINATNGINATNLSINNLSKGIFILNVKQAGTSVLQQKITVK